MPDAASLSPARHLVLVGYRGSGKSTIGKLVARLLGLDYLDTDLLIQEKAGKSIREIFADSGEEAFRDMETAVLQDLTTRKALPASVGATGGGMIMRPENQKLIKKLGLVVWLEVSPEMATARINADTLTAGQRPALTDSSLADEVERMISLRNPVYAELADITIKNNAVDQSADDIAEELISQIRPTPWYSSFEKRFDS
ncbi:MAG: shikimate kinase [bacterium]